MQDNWKTVIIINVSTFYLGKESLNTTHLCEIFLQYLRLSILKYNLVKKKKNENTANLFSLNLVLNKANGAYLELSGTAALPTSCQTHITSVGGSEKNVQLLLYHNPHTHSYPKSAVSFVTQQVFSSLKFVVAR